MRLVFLIALLCSACIAPQFGAGQDIQRGDLEWIEKGVTTEDEVIERLGTPESIMTDDGDSKILLYVHYGYAQQTHYPWRKHRAVMRQAFVTIGPDGLVEGWQFSESGSASE